MVHDKTAKWIGSGSEQDPVHFEVDWIWIGTRPIKFLNGLELDRIDCFFGQVDLDRSEIQV